MWFFAFATICPIVLVALAAVVGGVMAWIAVGYMTVLVFGMDRLIARTAANADPEAEFPGADALLITLGLAHFALLGLVVWAVAGASGLSGLERVLTGIAAGLIFGQISHPVAHELIHKPTRYKRLLGRVIYASIFTGHHASSHLLVHHIHVGGDADPNSAPKGQGFYRYAFVAAIGSFRKGFDAETRMLKRAGRAGWRHPYLLYGMVGLVVSTGIWWAFGVMAMIMFIAISEYAYIQILMSDYVQHYGLRRKMRDTGKIEPVGPQHSWNAPHWYSSAMMVNAPRHSDHHVVPGRIYPALQLDRGTMPMLPLPLPMMAVIALMPPLWRRVMDRRVAKWA